MSAQQQSISLSDITRKVYLKIGKSAIPKEFQDQMINCVSGKKNVSDELNDELLIRQFVESFIEVIASAPEPDSFKAIGMLFTLLRLDMKIFNTFKPIRAVIRKFKLERFMMQDEKVREPIFDFVCFVLRYYHYLDYEDITDVATLISRIKREEMNRSWVDIEDMVTRFEDLEAHFAATRETTAKSYEELFAYIDRIGKQYNESVRTMMDRLEKLETKFNNLKFPTFESVKKHEDALEALPEKLETITKMFTPINEKMAQIEQGMNNSGKDLDNRFDQATEKINKNLNDYLNDKKNVDKKFKDNDTVMEGIKQQNKKLDEIISDIENKEFTQIKDKFMKQDEKFKDYDQKQKEYDKLHSEVQEKQKNTLGKVEEHDLKLKQSDLKFKEIDLKIKNFDLKDKELDHKNDEINTRANDLDEKIKESFAKSKVLEDKYQEQLDRIRSIDNKTKDADAKIKGIEIKEKDLEYHIKNNQDLIKENSEKIIVLETKNEENVDKIRLLDKKSKEHDDALKNIQQKTIEIDNKHKNVDDKGKENLSRTQNLDDRLIALENKEKDFDLKHADLEVKNKERDNKAKELEQKLKGSDARLKEVEDKVRQSDVKQVGQEEKLNLFENKLTEHSEKNSLQDDKMRQIEDRIREFALKHKNLEDNKKFVDVKIKEHEDKITIFDEKVLEYDGKHRDQYDKLLMHESKIKELEDKGKRSDARFNDHDQKIKFMDIKLNDVEGRTRKLEEKTDIVEEEVNMAKVKISDTNTKNNEVELKAKERNLYNDLKYEIKEHLLKHDGQLKELDETLNEMKNSNLELAEVNAKIQKAEDILDSLRPLSSKVSLIIGGDKSPATKENSLKKEKEATTTEQKNNNPEENKKNSTELVKQDNTQSKDPTTKEKIPTENDAAHKMAKLDNSIQELQNIKKVLDEFLKDPNNQELPANKKYVNDEVNKVKAALNDIEKKVNALEPEQQDLKKTIQNLDESAIKPLQKNVVDANKKIDNLEKLLNSMPKDSSVVHIDHSPQLSELHDRVEALEKTKGENEKATDEKIAKVKKETEDSFPTENQKKKIIELISQNAPQTSAKKEPQDKQPASTEKGENLKDQLMALLDPIMKELSDEFTKENDKLWDYVQEFVNEQACSRIKILTMHDYSTMDKMDSMDWIARNIEFISPSLLDQACQIISSSVKSPQVNNLNKKVLIAPHSSDVVSSVLGLMKESEDSSNEAIFALTSGYLKILDALILSDFNLEKGVSLGLIENLTLIINEKKYSPQDQDLAFKILGDALRIEGSIQKIIAFENLFKEAVTKIESESRPEIFLSAVIIVKECLTAQDGKTKISKFSQTLPTTLFTKIAENTGKIDAQDACIQCLHYWYANPVDLTNLNDPGQLQKVLEISKNSTLGKAQISAIKFLSHCGKDSKLKDYLITKGFKDFQQ